MIAFDFETYLIGPEWGQFPPPICISYYDGSRKGIYAGKKDIEEALRWIFTQSGPIVIHNATFECGIIYTHFTSLRQELKRALDDGRIVCTKINEEILNCTRRTSQHKISLADLVLLYFNEDISEDKKNPNAWRLRYSELEPIPLADWPPEAVEYSISDSVWAYQVYQKQCELHDIFMYKHQEIIKAAVRLNLMSNLGMVVDVSRVIELEDDIYSKLDSAYKQLIAAGFCETVVGQKRPKKNMKHLRQYIRENYLKPILTAKGEVSTTEESLSFYLSVKEDSYISCFLTLAGYEKVITAFTNNLKAPLIRTQYSAIKDTCRTSASKSPFYPSVNIQQMPRTIKNVKWDVRNCFIPREGFKLCSIDYAGLELSSTAHQLRQVFRHSSMLDTINSGDAPVDMHSKLACRIMSIATKQNISYAQFVAHKKEPEYAHYRKLSKPINLGFPGGIGYDTMRHLLYREGIKTKYNVLYTHQKEAFVFNLWVLMIKDGYDNIRVARISKYEFALVQDELITFKNELYGLYPELKTFLKLEHEKHLTGETKKMKNDFGEWEEEPMYKYNIHGFKRDYCTYTAFCNGFLMQTPAAIGAKRATVNIVEKYLEHHDMRPLAFIHDEIVFEVKPDKLDIIEDVATLLIDGMQSVLKDVRITVEAELMDYWTKAGGTWSKTYWKDPNSINLRGI